MFSSLYLSFYSITKTSRKSAKHVGKKSEEIIPVSAATDDIQNHQTCINNAK